jgi:uncharacterized metal-binding protein YceD (DUF177 family)
MTAASDTPAPITRLYDLADLSEAGYEARIVPDAKDLARLAEWVEVQVIEKFEGIVELRRQGRDRFLYEADLEVDVVQSCVVTLEPVTSHISRHFHRVLHLIPNVHRFADKGGAVTIDAGDDDAPEEIARSRYDLAGPLLEEFVLAIDPYPRRPGVAFELPNAGQEPESAKPENPFAVLKVLKGQG